MTSAPARNRKWMCETNDVIHNTVGCMVGYSLAMLLDKRTKNIGLK